MTTTDDLPSHASPIISPIARPSGSYLTKWGDLDNSSQPPTPGIPDNLISPAFTPPLTPNIPGTPSHYTHEPKCIPVDTSLDDPDKTKAPRLLERLPSVECVVRARIPTTSGAEMFLHLYQNDADNKEHLAIVFGNTIRSRSLDAERPGETEMDRMIRGAYTGRLRPGRTSSRREDENDLRRKVLRTPAKAGANSHSHSGGGTLVRRSSGSSLKHVQTVPEEGVLETSRSAVDNEEENTSRPTSPTSTSGHAYYTTSASESDIKPPLVRIHSECYTGETAWSARCDCGEQLDEAARLMSTVSATNPTPDTTGGVIVYLRQEGRGIGLASKLKAYNLQDLGNDTVEANLLLRHPADARSYGLATAILQDLGLGTDCDAEKDARERGIRLLTNNPDKVRAVEGSMREVRVVERVAMVPLAWKSGGSRGVKGAEIEKYLETKIGRMGHMIHE